MRIMFSANAFWAHTGYATPVANLLTRLQKLGHQVANFAWFGLQGARLQFGDIVVYPSVPDRTRMSMFGCNVIGAWAADFNADLVVSVQDIWVLPEDYSARVKSGKKDVQWLCWFPVDHAPPPPDVLQMAPSVDWPCTYSRWGAEQMERAGEPVRYLPLGVDTEVFCPGDKAEARRRLGWPIGTFIAVMVAANKSVPSRKSYPEAFQAFAQFAEGRDAAIYTHCDWTVSEGGVDIPQLARACGIHDRLLLVDRFKEALGLPEAYLADVYRAADVLLLPSRTEGFGLPLVEAQACGCPVISTDFASMPELTWNGICVPPLQRDWTQLGSWEVLPSIEGVAGALEEVAGWSASERDANARVGIEAARRYDWDVLIRDYWVPLLAEVAAYGHSAAAGAD